MGSDFFQSTSNNYDLSLEDRLKIAENNLSRTYDIDSMCQTFSIKEDEREKIFYCGKRLPAGAKRTKWFRKEQEVPIPQEIKEILHSLGKDYTKFTKEDLLSIYGAIINVNRLEGTHAECLFLRYARKFFVRKGKFLNKNIQ